MAARLSARPTQNQSANKITSRSLRNSDSDTKLALGRLSSRGMPPGSGVCTATSLASRR